MKRTRFPLGQIVATKGVINLLDAAEIFSFLSRHARGDWGDLYQEDKAQNEAALLSGENRLFSTYNTSKGRVWIITEYDYSVTTILLPEDY